MTNSMTGLKYSDKYADFTIHCIDGDVLAHRYILHLTFGFFRSYLEQSLDDPAKDITVTYNMASVTEILKLAYHNCGYILFDESLTSDCVKCLDFFSPIDSPISYQGDIIKLLQY